MIRPALVLLAALCPLAPAPAGEPSLRWRGETHDLDELPVELPPEVLAAARPWGTWAERKGYRLELTDGADCLLVVSKRQRKAENDLELIGNTIAAVDGFLAPRPSSLPVADAGGDAPKKPGRLEDFDLPPLTPGVEAPPLEKQLPVLLKAYNTRDYENALEMLVETHAWLSDWATDTGENVYGLVLPRPLVGAWLVNAPDNEEWDPNNELVNRLAQLLVIDRTGIPPYWLQAGIAWHVELEVRGTIYCFPYRSGFVGIGEHGGWAPMLRNEFRDVEDSPPTMRELASLVRGSYVDRSAGLAWGTARWLIREKPERLAAILKDLDEVLRNEGIEVLAGGSWRTKPDWEIPHERQLEVLKRHIGRNVLRDLGAAFGEGL